MNQLVERISNIVQSNRKIIENFSFLTLFQILTLVSPLITYPYVIKTVGLDLFGQTVYAQTIISYFILAINFGFSVSGPKDVALSRESDKSLSECVSSIFIIKALIWCICTVVFILAVNYFDFFKAHKVLYMLTYLATIGEVLFPLWFFQGIEKMKYITYINIVVKIFIIAGIFLYVKEKSDYIYIPLINAFGGALSGIIGIYVVFKTEKVFFTFVNKKILLSYVKNSFTLFVSSISITIYMTFSKLVVGTFLGMREVALYDLGEKVITILKTPVIMISQSLFPKISREKSISFINKAMFFVLGCVTIAYVGLFFFSDKIVLFFIHEYNPVAVNIIRIFGLSMFFFTAAMFFGGLRLVPFGFSKEYMFVMVANGVVYLMNVAALWLFKLINIYSITVVYVIVEAFGLALVYYLNYRLKLLR